MKIYVIGFKDFHLDEDKETGVLFDRNWINPVSFGLKSYGVLVESPEEADVIIQLDMDDFARSKSGCSCGYCSVPLSNVDLAVLQDRYGSSKKYASYVWDCYTWASRFNSAGVKCGGSFDLDLAREVFRNCDHIFVPNEGTQNTVLSSLGIDSEVLSPFTRFFDYPSIKDCNYVCIAHRPYILDPTCDWGRRACRELEIPYIWNKENKGYSDFFKNKDNFERLLGECSFIVSTKFEASTGGMSLLEAHNLGKPVLTSNSRFNGATDIFGERAQYFEYNSYSDLKENLLLLWTERPKLDIVDCQEFCKNFTGDKMAQRIIEAVS